MSKRHPRVYLRRLAVTLMVMSCVSCDQASEGGAPPPVEQTDEGLMGGGPVGGGLTGGEPTEMSPRDMGADQALDALDMALIAGDDGLPSDMNVEPPLIATCEFALGGDPWDNMVVESQSGIEDELAELSFELLPDEVDISNLPSLFTGLIAYMLEVPVESLGGRLETAPLLSGGVMARVVAASLVLGLGSPLSVDFLFLRRGLHRYYHCDKGFPLTLEGFRASVFDYQSAEGLEHDSIAKCGPRRLVSDPERGVHVAETLVDGVVRETEIILEGRRRDGSLDFLIYNQQGRLSDRTRFPTLGEGSEVMASSPYVCTSCHLSTGAEDGLVRYDLLFPEVGPCE